MKKTNMRIGKAVACVVITAFIALAGCSDGGSGGGDDNGSNSGSGGGQRITTSRTLRMVRRKKTIAAR